MSSSPNNFFERISKVQRELSRLQQVLAREQEFNDQHVRKILEQPPLSSDSSNFSTEEHFVYRPEEDCIPAEIECLESSQSLFIQETLQNITKSTQNREQDAAAFVLKLQSELMASSMETEKAVHIGKTAKTQQKKRKSDQKPPSIGTSSAIVHQTTSGLLNGHRMKSPKPATKGSLKNISMKKSESHKELKKAMASSEVQERPMDRKKSSNKSTPFGKVTYPTTSNVFDARKFQADEPFRPLDARSPKLNKINVNRLKETIKKSNGEGKKGLEERLHLNLNEGKTLMQRILERRNFLREYNAQTAKYERALKEIDERSLQDELEQNTVPREIVDVLVLFLSQFSLKLTKRLLNCEINHNQLNHMDVVNELWKMVNGIPAKLFKNNVVSEERYHQLIKNCDQLWSRLQFTGVLDRVRRHKFVQLLQAVRSYMEFLFRNHLIETTERNNLYTKRRVVDYYSHRSDNQGIRKENAVSIPVLDNKRTTKKKPISKGYETERRLNIEEPNVKPNQPDPKKKNVHGVKENKHLHTKVFQPDRNMQLSTRSGKYCVEDKGVSAKRQIFIRK